MMTISIFTITSALHDEATIKEATNQFLGTLDFKYNFNGNDFTTYGDADLNLIYVRTGGTEGVFKKLQPQLMEKSSRPFYLLTSGKSNSLAASMEILSYLNLNHLKGEIIHGDASYINARVKELAQVECAVKKLRGMRLGVIGKPSDWLISSIANPVAIKSKLGIDLVDISIDEVLDEFNSIPDAEKCSEELANKAPTKAIKEAAKGAVQLYQALKNVVSRHQLNGFTIRCFDMLSVLHNTSCYALARLNAEGIVAGCEGDIPAMLTMAITQAVTGVSGFQANPSRINPETGEMLVAHCTIPLNMVSRYELDTHFESGIGIGIRGYMPEGEVTIFKVSGDLSRHFTAEATLERNQAEPNLCRTQQVIRLANPEQASYFLTAPIGNHHIIVPGHHAAVFNAILATADTAKC